MKLIWPANQEQSLYDANVTLSYTTEQGAI
jgi:hypothetical protein